MSGDFCQELEDFLSNEWILIADACAIFAGFIPISPYIADWSYEDSSREYLDLDGKRTSPNYKEIQRIQKKWKGSDWQVPYRNEVSFDRDPLNNEVRVRDAFKVGLAMRIERVNILYDAAVEKGLLPAEPDIPIPKVPGQKNLGMKKAKNLKFGYFEELEHWLESNPPKATAKPFVEYLNRDEEARARANVIEIPSSCSWIKYLDSKGAEQTVGLRAIQKAIDKRKK